MTRNTFFRFNHETGQVEECRSSKVAFRPKYPFECEAMAVHPEQIGEARDYDQSRGVPTDYTESGSPIIRDPGHYRRYRRAYGVHYRNGYES